MQYLTDRDLAKRFNIGRSTVWSWLSKDQLPQPVKFNGCTRWRESDLEKWEAKSHG